jgi:cell division protein DivIC
MKVNLGILDQLTKAVMFLLFVAGVMAVGVWYMPVIQKNESMRRDVLRMEKLCEEQEAANKRLKAAIDAAARDPRMVERLARERLNLARPGEVVFKFSIVETNPPPGRLN